MSEHIPSTKKWMRQRKESLGLNTDEYKVSG
jgi:hypothetical protein